MRKTLNPEVKRFKDVENKKDKQQFAESIANKTPDDFLSDKVSDLLDKRRAKKGKGKGNGKYYGYDIDTVADIVEKKDRDKATMVE